MKNEHIVLGAGPLGLAICDVLLQQGKQVTLVSRSKRAHISSNINFVLCDVTNKNQLQAILQHAKVVYHCIGLPYENWEARLPVIMQNIIETASLLQCKVVYADNMYAYGKQAEPLHERMAYRPLGTKTKVRATIATALMEAHKQGKIQATIGRGSDFFGPHVKQSILGERVFQHLIHNKKVELIGNPDLLHSHLYINDFAYALVILGDSDIANGHIWHVPHLPATTTRDLVEQIGAKLNKKVNYRIASASIVRTFGLFQPTFRHFKEILYQTTTPFVVDCRLFTQYFRFTCTTYEQAIDETIKWYKANQ